MPSDSTALGQFSVSEAYPSNTTPLGLTNNDIKIGDDECSADFVVIQQGTLASNTAGAAKDRYLKLKTLRQAESKFPIKSHHPKYETP